MTAWNGMRFCSVESEPSQNTSHDENDAAPVESTRQEAKKEFIELLKMVLVFLVVFWCVKTYVIEGYEVQGPSMLPTLHDRERILVFKLPHELSRLPFFRTFKPFNTGDVVVFDGVDNKRYVKRIIAMHPDCRSNTVNARVREEDLDNVVKVEYDHGKVRVNNWMVDESGYIVPDEQTSPDTDICLLRPGEYYVLGDHRSVSKDSRSFRAINDDHIVGQAVLRFWPLSKFGFL